MTEELIKEGDRVEIRWSFSENSSVMRSGKILQMARGSGDLIQVDFDTWGMGIMAINPHFWALQSIRKLEEVSE